MTTAKSTGHIVGLALLLQAPLAPIVNFRLVRPGTTRDFLVTAAGHAIQIRVGLLLALLASAITVAIALLALPLFRRSSERMAFGYVALSVVGVATVLAETAAARHMLFLSLEYTRLGRSEMLATLGELARSAWMSAHYMNLMVSVAVMLFLYAVLWRTALVPAWLAIFGVLTAAISITVPASQLVGATLPLGVMASIGVANLALMLWLLVRGFSDHGRPDAAVTSVGLAPA